MVLQLCSILHRGEVGAALKRLYVWFASGQYDDRNVCYFSDASTYVERDMREFFGIVDALKFLRFITVSADRK